MPPFSVSSRTQTCWPFHSPHEAAWVGVMWIWRSATMTPRSSRTEPAGPESRALPAPPHHAQQFAAFDKPCKALVFRCNGMGQDKLLRNVLDILWAGQTVQTQNSSLHMLRMKCTLCTPYSKENTHTEIKLVIRIHSITNKFAKITAQSWHAFCLIILIEAACYQFQRNEKMGDQI